MTPSRIRVLVVDDSAFARKVVREVLSADPDIEVVGFARDGLDALEKIGELDPDVLTLDLLMPNLDGMGVLNALAGKARPRVVVVSTSDEQSSLALAALHAGAVELVHKPTALATDRLYELSTELVQKVKIAALARPQPVREAPSQIPSAPRRGDSPFGMLVIGASTGGPQALTRLLSELPGNLPVPVAMVLHMPPGYTAALAERLNVACALDVQEAREGLALRPGLVVLGRAGMHLKIAGGPDTAKIRLDLAPLETAHRPSVDVLFTSAATVYGSRVLGVVLTGMGEDGLDGARHIHAAGGRLLTESESSCVVYGMPRAVAEAGLSAGSFPLEGMARAIQRAL
jgi:two-component system, chemotaxis family, protein-glutamate methylesterase/glutaminase